MIFGFVETSKADLGDIIDSIELGIEKIPYGLAWDGAYLWNSDQVFGMIYKINPSNGEYQSYPSPCSHPTGLTWFNENLWVADMDTNNIYMIPQGSGEPVVKFKSPGGKPGGLAYDGKYLWIGDLEQNKIRAVTLDGKEHDWQYISGIHPAGLAWDGRFLWCSDYKGKKILKIDIYESDLEERIVKIIDGGDNPRGLAWDGKDLWMANIYEEWKSKSQKNHLGIMNLQIKESDVSTRGGNYPRIVKIDTRGNVIHSVNGPGPIPTGIAWDGNNLWVGDFENITIYKISPVDGSRLETYDFQLIPAGLAWDNDRDFLWVADQNVKKIKRIDPNSGEPNIKFKCPGSKNETPYGLAYNGEYLYYADSTNKIYKIDPFKSNEDNTVVVKTYSINGIYPKGLTCDGKYLWVSDSINEKIYKINLEKSEPIIKEYGSPSRMPYGLTNDGEYLWNIDDMTDTVYKMDVGIGKSDDNRNNMNFFQKIVLNFPIFRILYNVFNLLLKTFIN